MARLPAIVLAIVILAGSLGAVRAIQRQDPHTHHGNVSPGGVVLGAVGEAEPQGAGVAGTFAAYEARVLFTQTWEEASGNPRLFQITGYRSSGETVCDLEEADFYIAPSSIAVGTDGLIYISDTGAQRIQRLDRSGRQTLSFGHDSSAHYTDLGTTVSGYVYALNDGRQPSVYRFDAHVALHSVYVLASGSGALLRVYPSGRFDVLEPASMSESRRVLYYNSKGMFTGSEVQPLSEPPLFRYEDWTEWRHRVVRVEGSQVRLLRASQEGMPAVLDYTETEGDTADHILGFDRAGRLYRLVEVPAEASRATKLFVQVIELDPPGAWVVPLGECTDLVRRPTRVTVDASGCIYHLRTSLSGLEVVRYSPGGP